MRIVCFVTCMDIFLHMSNLMNLYALLFIRYQVDEIQIKVDEFRKMLLEKQGLDKEKQMSVKSG